MLSLPDEILTRFKQQYQTAPIDIPSFYRKYKACGFGECSAICCNGGTGFYYEEEAQNIQNVVNENPEFFKKQGLSLPEKLFYYEEDEETGKMEPSTETRDVEYPKGVKPAHFPSTTCIFRADSGACSLQALSVEQGKDSWWHKPFSCWMFPIELEYDGLPHIRVAHHSTDEYVDNEYPGFVGYVKCGMECAEDGKPAYQILEKEIATLSTLLGRDLLKEILAYDASKQNVA